MATSSNGVMDECSGKVQKVGTHRNSLIMMDLAVVESHLSAVVNIKASALPNKEKVSGQRLPTG